VLDKIKNTAKHPYITELRDVRVLGLLVFGVIVLLVSWSGVRVIETNYQLQQQIARMEEQTKLLELENANKKLDKSDQYLELQARKQFGKAAPGEKLLLVPKNVALAHTVDLKQPKEAEKQEATTDKPFYQKNFESWMDFMFRHTQT